MVIKLEIDNLSKFDKILDKFNQGGFRDSYLKDYLAHKNFAKLSDETRRVLAEIYILVTENYVCNEEEGKIHADILIKNDTAKEVLDEICSHIIAWKLEHENKQTEGLDNKEDSMACKDDGKLAEITRKSGDMNRIMSIIDRLSVFGCVMKCFTFVTVLISFFHLNSANLNLFTLGMFVVPVLGYWVMDGYFLWQERLMRCIYSQVGDHDYQIKVTPKEHCKGRNRHLPSIFSKTLIIFYLTELAALGLYCFSLGLWS